jgi:hypothetical protein
VCALRILARGHPGEQRRFKGRNAPQKALAVFAGKKAALGGEPMRGLLRALPSSVLGPVLNCAFKRLAAICRSLAITASPPQRIKDEIAEAIMRKPSPRSSA